MVRPPTPPVGTEHAKTTRSLQGVENLVVESGASFIRNTERKVRYHSCAFVRCVARPECFLYKLLILEFC